MNLDILHSFDSLSLVVSPVQIAVVAVIGIAVFAPHLIPPLARMLGKLVGLEVKRRTGISPASIRRESRPIVKAPQQIIEVLPPEEPVVRRAEPLKPERLQPLPAPPPQNSMPIWGVVVIVAGSAGVLLWLLLHAR